MSWPSVTNAFPDAKTRYRENAKAKKAALKAQIQTLKLKQAQNVPVVRKSKCDAELAEYVQSKGFQEWYEELTCKDGAHFSDWLLNCEEWVLFGRHRNVFIVEKIKLILSDYRWQSPHYKRYWAKHISECKDAHQRRAVMLRLATPKWADLCEVARFHKRRAEMAINTGIPHDVDHIIPLQGVLVCGLNCEFNLRIIPAAENRSKSNKYEIA